MNPAQLLNPKAFAKSQPRASRRSSSHAASKNVSESSKSLPLARGMEAFPKPKPITKRARAEPLLLDNGSGQGLPGEATSMGTMIERIHGVQDRENQPVKRHKHGHMDEHDSRHAAFGGAGGDRVLGQYVNEQRQQREHDTAPRPPAVVDLTTDDNNDVVFIKDDGDEEVCLGKIESPFVTVYMIPSPKLSSYQGSVAMWPAFKVSLRRRPAANDILIAVTDPHGRDFARIDARVAMALQPLMDNALLELRIDARMEARRRMPGETAGSATSLRLPLTIHLFAPRRHAKIVGRVLSQKQVWLRDPSIRLGRIPYENPQLIKVAARSTYSGADSGVQSNCGFVARTVEEIRSDVIGMFDTLARSDDIPEMEQPDIIKTQLLAHQKQALHFMTSREDEEEDDRSSLWKVGQRGNGQRYFYNIITGHETRQRPHPTRGGILADMMGLGKTLSILSLIAATAKDASKFASKRPPQSAGQPLAKCNSKATLLVCPLSTVVNWKEQVELHVRAKHMSYHIYHGPNRITDPKDLAKYDLVVTTYNVVAAEHCRAPLTKPLAMINWFRIVLDEAHMIRSTATKQSIGSCALLAQRRWAVTGTPVQNRLEDLGALIKFLRIRPFDDLAGFARYILSPFKNADPEILPKLRILVDSITLRRLKNKINLPPRHDRLVRLNFSPEERRLYDFFARDASACMASITAGRDRLARNQMGHILCAIARLRMICAHGAELLSDDDMKLTEGLSQDNAIELGNDDDDDEKPAISKEQAYNMLHLLRESDMHHCGLCDRVIGSSDITATPVGSSCDDDDDDDESDARKDTSIGFMTSCYHLICPNCLDEFKRRMKTDAAPDCYMVCPLCGAYAKKSVYPLTREDAERDEAARQRVRNNPRLSKQLGRYGGPHTKVKVLIESLLESKAWSDAHPDEPPIKSVVFSSWTSYLDLISIAFEENSLRYTRLDGTMSRNKRTAALADFRDKHEVQIMLISITAGGLGLNLTSASNAYVMEPQYNPAAEAQAVDRVHRLGQKREVVITRFIMNNSFEEMMLKLQKKKKDLADLSMNRNTKLDRQEAAKKRLEDLRSLFR